MNVMAKDILKHAPLKWRTIAQKDTKIALYVEEIIMVNIFAYPVMVQVKTKNINYCT